jgi:hypothetical protein
MVQQSLVRFEPKSLVRELIAYGEPEAAEKLMTLEPAAIEAIGIRAHQLWSEIMLDKAICLAIVEYVEGAPRPLRRKRRTYAKPSTSR